MSESIAQRTNGLSNGRDTRELAPVLEAIRTDLTELRTELAATIVDVAALAAAVDTLATKLNADAGVTDEDYSAANAAAVTASSPSALTTKA